MKYYLFKEFDRCPVRYWINSDNFIDEHEAKKRLQELWNMGSSFLENNGLNFLTAPPPKHTHEITQERIDNALKLISELKKTLICIANNNRDS